jgi:DNA-binding MarR family transcriptional regulator
MPAVAHQTTLPVQPWLFEMGEPDPAKLNADREYRRAIDAVLKARRELLSFAQERGIPQINMCLEALRSISRLSDSQSEEIILHAIERQGATTLTEIAEDSRLAPAVVKVLVKNLLEKNILYLVPKFIPGSDRQYFMYKSNRVKTPEVV